MMVIPGAKQSHCQVDCLGVRNQAMAVRVGNKPVVSAAVAYLEAGEKAMERNRSFGRRRLL
jgi:hypothetical protein